MEQVLHRILPETVDSDERSDAPSAAEDVRR